MLFRHVLRLAPLTPPRAFAPAHFYRDKSFRAPLLVHHQAVSILRRDHSHGLLLHLKHGLAVSLYIRRQRQS
jgi:hypothetical protein